MELYRDSLVELERMVVESEQWGPVIVTGDFNARPYMGGPELTGTQTSKVSYSVKFSTDVNSMLCPWGKLFLALSFREFFNHCGLHSGRR